MIHGLTGVDHTAVLVRDLDHARDAWAALGFVLSPRGVHSAARGTANHTIMLGPDYIELVGVVAPTEHNAPSRAFLMEGEGIERTGFRALDAQAAATALRAKESLFWGRRISAGPWHHRADSRSRHGLEPSSGLPRSRPEGWGCLRASTSRQSTFGYPRRSNIRTRLNVSSRSRS